MARKERNSVDYFPHNVNHGKKMFFIRSKYKNDGYSVWFMLMEELGKAEYHYLDLNSNISKMYLSSSMMVSEELLYSIINDLVKLGEFDELLWINGILFNEKFIDSISDAYKKRNNTCINKKTLITLLTSKGILNESKRLLFEVKSTTTSAVNTQRKEKKRKEKKTIEEYSENAKILNEFSRPFFDLKYLNEKSLEMFDKLIKRYSEEQIKAAITNAKADKFWSTNFLSPMKLTAKDKTGVSYIDVFLNLKPQASQQSSPKRRMVHYEMNGFFYTHYEMAYNQNLQSLGAEKVKFLNYVEDGN